MRYSCFLIVCLLFKHICFSQSDTQSNIRELVKIPIPPSPNAASLGKFGDIPVGLSTGIPSISIPFFSWKDDLKELTVDVLLSYHAGGHKVEDMASNCGLGWALNAGGVISRTIKGLPDDGQEGYLNTPPLRSVFTAAPDHMNMLPGSTSIGFHYGNSTYYDTIRKISERYMDGEADIFNLSVGNISAKFFIDKNGDVNFLTQTNLNLQYNRNPSGPQSIYKFTLTDERAIKYIFDVTETTDPVGLEIIPGSQSMYCITSFYLSKIISGDGRDSILFTYTGSGSLVYESGFSETYTVTWANGAYTYNPQQYNYNTITTGSTRISQISFPDSTKINFSYGFARDDYDGDYGLTSVTMSNGSESRKFELNYDYFSTAYDPYAGTVYSPNDYSKRLKLTQVQQISGADSIPPYILQYNSTNLPPRNSRMQDHWGYYSGGANSNYSSTIYQAPNPAVPDLPGANRAANGSYSIASVLEKIIYPTGGYTKFIYHGNDSHTSIYNIGGKVDSIRLDENAINNYTSLPFTNRNKDTVRFISKIYNNQPPPEMEPWDENCNVSVTVKSTDNTVLETINFTYSTIGNAYLVLPLNKTYQIKYESDCTWWLEDFIASTVYFYAITPTNKEVGGLRVEKVEDNDSIGNKTTTEYEYLRTDGSSSGEIQHVPNYAYYKSTTYHPLLSTHDLHWTSTSSTTQTLSFFRGSPIIYKRVKVKKASSSSNIGYSIHEFSGFEWAGIYEDQYPYLQKQDIDWKQGLGLRDSVFNSSNQLVKNTQSEWEDFSYNPDSSIYRNIITGMIYHDDQSTFNQYVYGARSYTLARGRSQLKKTTETMYENGDSIKIIKEFSYDNNKFQLTREKTINSKGDSVENRLYYPFNYSISTDNAVNTLISKETWKKRNGTWYFTGATVNEYDQFNSSFIKPKKIIAAEVDDLFDATTIGAFDPADLTRHASFKDQVEYLQYDDFGRYTEIKAKSSPVTSLIWSPQRNYPVAQVVNASETDIAYSSFETEAKGKWIYSGSTSIHPNAITGTRGYSLAGGNITRSGLNSGKSYTVTYWKRDSTSTVTVNSGSGTLLLTRNGWKLYRHVLTGVTSLTISGTAYIDELRLHPSNAQMSTTTYLPLSGMSSQCDPSNKIIYYEYDKFSRLRRIKDQDNNILKVFDYQYKQNQNQ